MEMRPARDTNQARDHVGVGDGPRTQDGAATPRLGRPPRVTPAQIAEAALAVGLDRATVRNVAEQLGMSVPGLYHHVRSREELVAMAAAHSLRELPLPEDHGQAWTEWLLEYARFVYDALIDEPEIIGQIVAGTVDTLRLAQHLERFFAVLTAHGFTTPEAYAAYVRLTAAITGAATAEIGRRSREGAGGRMSDLAAAVRALGDDTVPLVGELLRAHRGARDPDPFETVRLVVDGLAAAREPRSG
jgi:AcrR family transcriptional regulator